MNKEIINGEDVEQLIKSKIYVIRGQKVMLDFDIAELYDVQTSRLNEQVRRNIDRFPIDFTFQLNDDEFKSLISQIAISKVGRGGRRKMPYAFTEHGVAMLSSVLNSREAIQMNILIIRIFIKVKEWILSNKDLEIKVEKIEKKQKEQGDLLNNVNSVLTQLVEKPIKPLGKLGFNE